MADKSELKLAEGSSQETELDGCIIAKDIDGTTCAIGRDSVAQSTDYGHLLLVDIADGENCLNAPASAVLTVIRAAGLDPEYLELKRLRAENEALRARCDESQRERDDLADQICSARRTLRRLAQSQRKGG